MFFHLLAVVNKAVMNICTSFLFCFFEYLLLLPLSFYLGVEFLGHVIFVCLIFHGTARLLHISCTILHSY